MIIPSPLQISGKTPWKKDGLHHYCKVCHNIESTKYREKNREKCRASNQKYIDSHPEKRRESLSKYYLKNKELVISRSLESHFKIRYNITMETYKNMLEMQNGCCKICKKHTSELKRKLAVDHCHKTGKVRGLLCKSCNSGIGFFNDNLDILLSAIVYLKETK